MLFVQIRHQYLTEMAGFFQLAGFHPAHAELELAHPYLPLLQNFLQLQPTGYNYNLPPNPHYDHLLKSHSKNCILEDFLAYLLSHPDSEGEVTERIFCFCSSTQISSLKIIL